MKTLNSSVIEDAISLEGITRELYCEKISNSNIELVDFDTFLLNISEAVNDVSGTIEDAIEMATDAFNKL